MFKISSILLVAALVLPGTIRADVVTFSKCSTATPAPKYVSIEGCDTSSCVIKSGQDFVWESEFTSPITSDNLKSSLKMQLMGMWTDITAFIPPESWQACNLLEGGCPLTKGETRIMKINVPIIFPFSTDTVLQFTATDATTGKEAYCSRYPVSLKLF